MTKSEIVEHLIKLEYNLIVAAKKQKPELTRIWANTFPNSAAVYIFREEGEICYVGETGNLRGRMNDILNTKNHSLRRNLGKSIFLNHVDYIHATSKVSYPANLEELLNERFRTKLTISFLEIGLGRKELEERIFGKFKPKYNIKGKRGAVKSYTKKDKQVKYKKAYEPWTVNDDEKLEELYCLKKSVKELSVLFQRNDGAIRSRIKKLELKEKYGN